MSSVTLDLIDNEGGNYYSNMPYIWQQEKSHYQHKNYLGLDSSEEKVYKFWTDSNDYTKIASKQITILLLKTGSLL